MSVIPKKGTGFVAPLSGGPAYKFKEASIFTKRQYGCSTVMEITALFDGFMTHEPEKGPIVTRILKSGPYTHVFWADGTKTSVRRSPDEEDNNYAAFTAALAIKMYGSNSALKRMLKDKIEVQKPKEKKTQDCTDTCPIDYEAIERTLKAQGNAT